MPCLRAQHVAKSYDGIAVLRDASLEIGTGEILALLGPNGSGKTTLIKILATLLTKDAGEVIILGHDLDQDEDKIRYLFGYVGQDAEHSAYARLTVCENLRFFGAMRGLERRRIDAQIERLAVDFDFAPFLGALHMALSGGQKQIVAIVRALLPDPPLIYLDEPTKGLDPLIARRVRNSLRRYAVEGKKSVLLTSHVLSEVEELADRVALIQSGQIETIGTPDALKRALDLTGVFEIRAALLSEEVEAALARIGSKRMAREANGAWVAIGVGTSAATMQSVLQLLHEKNLDPHYRYRSVSLEDALLHHYGRRDETLDR
jgi:ABC-type multidrug transport system ATPase subunit